MVEGFHEWWAVYVVGEPFVEIMCEGCGREFLAALRKEFKLMYEERVNAHHLIFILGDALW